MATKKAKAIKGFFLAYLSVGVWMISSLIFRVVIEGQNQGFPTIEI